MRRWSVLLLGLGLAACGDGSSSGQAAEGAGGSKLLNEALTTARAADGRYISWREHRIDDEPMTGVPLRGGDGLVMGDLDKDGYPDIVSVHESDDVYDGAPEGYIRIAFGTADADHWIDVTLSEGPEAAAAEDAAIADINGDGWPDIVAAVELAHLVYFQNPGKDIQQGDWPRLVPSITLDRGSFIRVFAADLNGDGLPELSAANKGAQDPTRVRQEPKAISVFEIKGGRALDDDAWVEHVLTRVPWPINAQTVDVDGDGDIDVIGGSVAEGRAMWFENVGTNGLLQFNEHPMTIAAPALDAPPTFNAFNLDFADLNADGRLDIAGFDTTRLVGEHPVWLEQPATPDGDWILHRIGDYAPDRLVGLALGDIDGDGDYDLMTGGYSGASSGPSSRLEDGVANIDSALGRLAWFENRGPDDWVRHDFSRRERGMFDKFVPMDFDGDGDLDFFSTRGNSGPYDGVFWLEQIRTDAPVAAFEHARDTDSPEFPLP